VQNIAEADGATSTGCPLSKDALTGELPKEAAPPGKDVSKSSPVKPDRELEEALAEARKHNGLSQDLRMNPGGGAEFGANNEVPHYGKGIGQAPQLSLPWRTGPIISEPPTFGKEMAAEPPGY